MICEQILNFWKRSDSFRYQNDSYARFRVIRRLKGLYSEINLDPEIVLVWRL